MSANDTKDNISLAESQSTFTPEKKTSPTGMEFGPILPPRNSPAGNHSRDLLGMAIITPRSGHPPALWEQFQRTASPLQLPTRPRQDVNNIKLPSIRHLLERDSSPIQGGYESESPVSSLRASTLLSEFPEPLLQKRRKVSIEELREHRDYTPHRRSRSPSRQGRPYYSGNVSPLPSGRRGSVLSAGESWCGSSRTSPHLQTRSAPVLRSPSFDGQSLSGQDYRPKLPSLPAMRLDREATGGLQSRGHFSEYSYTPSGSVSYPYPATITHEPSPFQNHGRAFPVVYQQPRGQTYPPSERTPFSTNGYQYAANNYPYGMEINDAASSSKQRKRRGNLPKETTEVLRAWFMDHLNHPYPDEEQKQELIRRTGLQMNQIANWFINARRRQLPNLVNNAKVAASRQTDMTRGEHEGRSGSQGHERDKEGESEGDSPAFEEHYYDTRQPNQ